MYLILCEFFYNRDLTSLSFSLIQSFINVCERRIQASALRALDTNSKQVSFYEKVCNHYSMKSNFLYF